MKLNSGRNFGLFSNRIKGKKNVREEKMYKTVLFFSLSCWNTHEFGMSFASTVQQTGFHRRTLRECTTRIYPKALLFKASMTKELHRIGCYCPFGFEEPESWIHCTWTFYNRLQEHPTLWHHVLFWLPVMSHFSCHVLIRNQDESIIHWDTEALW